MNFKRYMKSMMVAVVLLVLATTAFANQPKYVFFFLGDGMSATQIQATEAYLTTLNGGSARVAADLLKPENRLNMSKMPVVGMQTTYDAYALMTDSASSATAFACGIKTKSGVIGMDDTKTFSYKSIAQLAHEDGKKVGIITSVSLDHATPAAYYASVASRGEMNNIATQLANTGYEFFGGGGLVSPTDPTDVWSLLKENGYAVLNDRESILALKDDPMDKVVCINRVLPGTAAAMPYAIDKPEENLSLAEMTEVAIANLYEEGRRGKRFDKGRKWGHSRKEGFFIMVEGGKIDWACHANDAVATIGDMLDFDNAVGVALDFYKKHPHETLVVVTGDHETGGMTIGHATTGYTAYYDRLMYQTNSYEHFGMNEWADYKKEGCPTDIDDKMIGLMYNTFGLEYNKLNVYQQEKLEDAFDKSCRGPYSPKTDYNDYLLYGGYDPIIVTITHILNENASIGWTSYSHTGVPVPLFAQGREAMRFAGFYDNTDIAKKLARVMGIRDELPVTK
jgi:alkaline phosphatase